MYRTYVLLSRKFCKTYVGQTEDLDVRLKKHNEGRVRSTKAMEREAWYKTPEGRKKIAELVEARVG